MLPMSSRTTRGPGCPRPDSTSWPQCCSPAPLDCWLACGGPRWASPRRWASPVISSSRSPFTSGPAIWPTCPCPSRSLLWLRSRPPSGRDVMTISPHAQSGTGVPDNGAERLRRLCRGLEAAPIAEKEKETMYKATVRALIRRSIRHLNAGNYEPLLAMYANDAELAFPGDNFLSRQFRSPHVGRAASPTHRGKAELEAFLRRCV